MDELRSKASAVFSRMANDRRDEILNALYEEIAKEAAVPGENIQCECGLLLEEGYDMSIGGGTSFFYHAGVEDRALFISARTRRMSGREDVTRWAGEVFHLTPRRDVVI